MAGGGNGIVLTGDLAGAEVARLQWIESATPEERAALAGLLRECDITTLPGINKFLYEVTISILVGELSPSLAAAAKPWIELLNANTLQMMAQAGHAEHGPSVVTEQLIQLKRRVTMNATYSTDPRALPSPVLDQEEADDLIEASERVKVG